MSDAEEQLARVKHLYPQAEKLMDGAKPVVLIPEAVFPVNDNDEVMDLLLYPYSDRGYPTRLFYRRQLPKGQNWTQHVICQESWWAPSYNDVRADLPWDTILARHLRAVA